MSQPEPDGYVQVVAVNVMDALIILDDDQIVPIVKWYKDGEECDEPGEADAAMAGPTENDQWIAVDLTLFDTAFH